ncbi:MAG: septum formation initiator family protein [Opitutae bacterium]
MIKKKIFPSLLLVFSLACLVYLTLQVNQALQEYKHWKTRESVLEKELEVLREEARIHQQFLDRLRRNPDFQDEVARKELGYGNAEEWLYRFPEEPTD